MLESDGFVKNGRAMMLYTYSTEHLPNKDKVRFYYALKGRDGKTGIVKQFHVQHLGKLVLLAEAKYDEDMILFFKVWNLPYTRRKAFVEDEIMRGGPP